MDLSEEQLRDRILQPYEYGRPITVNGKTIEIKDLERIRISRSPESSKHYISVLREEDLNSPVFVLPGPSDEWRIAARCEDVTDEYVKGAPGYKMDRLKQRVGPSHAVRVFISYSHDSHEHMNRVLALSDRLRVEGVDCNIDQYEESPPDGWPRWMVDQIEQSDFVLVVCTPSYETRFAGRAAAGTGLGANWEGAVLTQNLYSSSVKNSKFVPIVFSKQDTASIPVVLRGTTYYDLSTGAGYEALYRRLTGQPSVVKPQLGAPQAMPERRQYFSPLVEDSLPQETPSTPAPTAIPLPDARHLLQKVTQIADLMIQKVANNYVRDESQYPQLRFELLSDTRIRSLLPLVVRECRSLTEVYAFVSGQGFSPKRVEWLRNQFHDVLEQLESIVLSASSTAHTKSAAGTLQASVAKQKPSKVFVVHGRDEALKEATARFIERLGLQPVILSEQVDQGRTIFQKFLDHAEDVAFAIVLLTPDDHGRLGAADQLRQRARQNVILELGYFLAALGPERVCAVYTGDVELPSDIAGRLHVPYDAAGMWRFRVAREMNAAGLGVDLNRLL